MMLAVAAVAAGAAFADVQSSNIVGYKTEDCTIPRTLTMKFWQTGNAGEECNIKDILDMSTVAAWDDILQLYDADYGVFNDYQVNDNGDWINAFTEQEIDINVVPGNSFIAITCGEWTFAGEVPELTSYTHEIDEYIPTLVGNAFPVAAKLGDFDWSGIAAWDDIIQLYDADYGVFNDYQVNDNGDWINAFTEEPLADDADLSDGFIIIAGLTELVQNFPTAE